MIRLQQKSVHPLQGFHGIIIVGTQIRDNSHFLLSMGNPVSHRLRRVVGDGDRVTGQILDDYLFVRPDDMEQPVRQLPHRRSVFDRSNGSCRGINRHGIFPAQNSQPRNMIRVLMSDQYPVNIFHGKLQSFQPFLRPFPADSHIHQKVSGLRSHINTVPAASAGNTTNSHMARILSSISLQALSRLSELLITSLQCLLYSSSFS